MSNLMNPGHYFGTLVNVAAGATKKNVPQIVFTWEISHEAGDGEWIETKPFKRFSCIYFSEGAIQFSFDKLNQLDFNGSPSDPKISDFGALWDAAADSAKGIELVCEHEQKQNSDGFSEKWTPLLWLENANPGVTNENLKRDDAARMDSMWKNYAAARKAK